MSKILIIQTAFIGDVILATPLIEKLAENYPDSQIDFLLRKGNEGLLGNHPKVNRLLIWDKKKRKYKNLFSLLMIIRKFKYDYVINLQRFFSTGLLVTFSGSKFKIGFDKNPFSFMYSLSVQHQINNDEHEVVRNLSLIKLLVSDVSETRPKLYPSEADYEAIKKYKKNTYICLAPASVWYTKQLPFSKWVELVDKLPPENDILFIGGIEDTELCESIISASSTIKTQNLCGKLSLLQSAALMQSAKMNFVNDSAPLHLASAVNAPTTAFFCSTIPEFGFGPLSEESEVKQVSGKLHCRPCGLHGKKACPEGHFKCGHQIKL